MASSDPIADLLAKMRNDSRARLAHVEVPASRLKVTLLDLLKREGFIRSYQPMSVGAKKSLRIYLRFLPGHRPVFSQLRRVSKPGLRKYIGAAAMPRVVNGRGIAVLSTSGGLMTDEEARRAHVGGEVLCHIW